MFVHGFTGSPYKTWAKEHRDDPSDSEPPSKVRKLGPYTLSQVSRAGRSVTVFWPRDLLPITVPHARVLTYGYDTHLRHVASSQQVNKMGLNDLAREFLVCVEAKCREEPSRPILFVCHSLGGIVTKEMLRQANLCTDDCMRKVFKSTIGIIFFGTPHRGADPRQFPQHIAEKLAKIAGISMNQGIMNTLLPTSVALRQLNDDFSGIAQRQSWNIYSFQEAQGVFCLGGNKVKCFGLSLRGSPTHYGMQVVEDMSSYLGFVPLETTQHINKDHMDMCRFTTIDDTEYQKVAAALRKMTSNINSAGSKDDESGCVTLSGAQRTMLLSSLRFDEIDSRFKSIKNTHAKTCSWFLKSPQYLNWLDIRNLHSHHGFLWIKGKPGAGKSTLMKFLFSRFKTKMPRNKVCFYFNARGAELEKTTIGMYRSLLLQILQPRAKLQCAFDKTGLMTWNVTENYDWSVEQLKQVFSEAVSRLDPSDPVTCFIDALDECDEAEIRDMVEFFDCLASSALANRIPFQVAFSSRHYPHITISNSIDVVLEQEQYHSEDIQRYVEDKLKIPTKDGSCREQILNRILEKASGVFMWVVLVVDILNKAKDEGRPPGYLLEKLKELPDNLHDLFRDILVRDKNHQDELLLCLQWVLFARRSLKPKELYCAIHAGISPQFLQGYVPDEHQVKLFILSSSKGLVEAINAGAESVQFIHESVRDFLLKEGGLKFLSNTLGNNFEGESHDRLKTCCVTYMSMSDIQQLIKNNTPHRNADDSITSVAQQHPFLEYATQNLLQHANAAAVTGLEQGDFLSEFALTEWVSLHNLVEKFQARHYKSIVSLLYVLAEANLAALIRIHAAASGQHCLEIEDQRFGTPLFAARATKSDDAALALMQSAPEAEMCGIKTTDVCELFRAHRVKDTFWSRKFRYSRRHSLSSHASANSDHVIAIFCSVSRPAKHENSQDFNVQEMFKSAVRLGDHGIVKSLLDNGAEKEARDNDGLTLLIWASLYGYEAIVKLLLDNGAEKEAKDHDDFISVD